MAKLTWDSTGEKLYELGVDRGVLYVNTDGEYTTGVAWNGLTAVTESPSGAETTKIYANNGTYGTLVSTEEFGGTIEAYTYPDEFGACNGQGELVDGAVIGQQTRSVFGFTYRTMIGNDTDGQEHGYKIHIVYGALVSPSESAYQTINDSPEAVTMSWEFTTTPVSVNGFKPTSLIVVDSTKADKAALAKLEAKLYGDTSSEPELPMPDEVKTLLTKAA